LWGSGENGGDDQCKASNYSGVEEKKENGRSMLLKEGFPEKSLENKGEGVDHHNLLGNDVV